MGNIFKTILIHTCEYENIKGEKCINITNNEYCDEHKLIPIPEDLKELQDKITYILMHKITRYGSQTFDELKEQVICLLDEKLPDDVEIVPDSHRELRVSRIENKY